MQHPYWIRRVPALAAAALFAIYLVVSVVAQAPNAAPVPSEPSVPPQGIPGVIAPGVQLELVQETFRFTEGPTPSKEGGLYFSDLLANLIYYMSPAGKISIFAENTGGGNGTALMKDGSLVVAENSGKRITRYSLNGTPNVLTTGVPGQPLLAPNDLIVDSKGGIYYTDPAPAGTLPGTLHKVYYLPPGKSDSILVDGTIDRPNGITLSADGKILIVDDTSYGGIYFFEIQKDGTLKNKREFAKLQGIPPDRPNTAADGMTLDRDGRLYVTSFIGVQIFDKSGKYLGVIKVPRANGNVAFSGAQKSVLYIAARQGLYRIQTLTHGLSRLGK